MQPTLEFAGCETAMGSDELSAFDANLDGLDDLIIGDAVALSDGAGGFTESAIVALGDKNLVDVNGDGVLDIISETETLCGHGDGSFASCAAIDNEPLVEVDLEKFFILLKSHPQLIYPK